MARRSQLTVTRDDVLGGPDLSEAIDEQQIERELQEEEGLDWFEQIRRDTSTVFRADEDE